MPLKRRLTLSLIVAATLSAGSAAADDKAACIAAFEDAGQLRAGGKLLDARRRLAQCGSDACPALVQKECARELASLEAVLPSIIVTAREARSGTDVVRGRLTIDGTPAELNGRAVTLDPGQHVIRFEPDACKPVEVTALVLEAERNRKVDLVADCAVAIATPPPPPRAEPTRSLALPLVLAGVGVLGVGGFAYFGLKGSSEIRDIRATGCAPECDRDEVQRARTKLLVGDVLGAVGVVALGAATWVLLASPSRATTVEVRPSPTGGTVSVTKAF